MATLFISDLHLSGERPHIITLFTQFLREEARRAEALYILGDLFEVWLGDDAVPGEIQPVINELRDLTSSDVPVFVMVGNRDFLLGKDFEKATGCQLLPDPSVIDLYGVPTLLMHGDTLCTDDVDYQTFRAQVRDPAWQTAFLAKSIEDRIAFGKQARAESKARAREKTDDIMDVNPQAVIDTLSRHQTYRLIHGHTHRPAVHKINLGDQTATRIVLGDWYEQESVLKVDTSGLRLSGNPQTNWY